MIYVGVDPALEFTIDDHLGELARYFDLWQFDKMLFVGEHRFDTRNNWKLTVDTFFEGYHFSVVHKESVGDYAFGNLSTHDSFGPHQRLAYPNKSLLTLKDIPQEQWTTAVFDHFQLIHYPLSERLVAREPDRRRVFPVLPRRDRRRVHQPLSLLLALGSVPSGSGPRARGPFQMGGAGRGGRGLRDQPEHPADV